ncbi:MAG: phospholipid/glycerol acyltransferase [Methylocystaceae bacterium]|nr:MAG: phospholipid/glycerol acyltransferase [Methylocystaceae bacterium]
MAARGEAPTLAPVAISYADGVRRIDVGWYGDMSFLPHLWRLMKRGRTLCHIAFGDAIETTGKNRKTLAAETRARVCESLASVDGADRDARQLQRQ